MGRLHEVAEPHQVVAAGRSICGMFRRLLRAGRVPEHAPRTVLRHTTRDRRRRTRGSCVPARCGGRSQAHDCRVTELVASRAAAGKGRASEDAVQRVVGCPTCVSHPGTTPRGARGRHRARQPAPATVMTSRRAIRLRRCGVVGTNKVVDHSPYTVALAGHDREARDASPRHETMQGMETRTMRAEKILDIGTALGCLVLVLVAGHVLLFLADRSVALSAAAPGPLSNAITAAACICAAAYLMRAGRRSGYRSKALFRPRLPPECSRPNKISGSSVAVPLRCPRQDSNLRPAD